ncbi:prenyltransferase [Nostoc sp. CHAB 5834]|nr:prenyltransferase [Nostoc sp. CHAB 5834]
MFLKKFISTLILGRIKFLSYSPILYGLGATIATFAGEKFNLSYFILGQITVWVIHMMTHFYNEYYDLDSDKLNKYPSPWTGGSRILPKGILSPQTSIRLGVITTILSFGLSLLMPSFETRLICWVSLILSWGYSAPPLAFCRRGLGELITAVVLNVLTPVLGFFLQNGNLYPGRTKILFLVLLPLAIVEYVRMMVMNMPDRDCDSAVGKDTLIVKVGMNRAIQIHAMGMLVAYLSLGFMYLYSDVPPVVLLLILSTAPLGFLTTIWVYKHWQDRQKFFMVPFWASTHNALAALSALVGFIICCPSGYLLQPETHLKAFSVYLYLAVFLYFRWADSRRNEQEIVGWETESQQKQAV